jgi:hypothetical protein
MTFFYFYYSKCPLPWLRDSKTLARGSLIEKLKEKRFNYDVGRKLKKFL